VGSLFVMESFTPRDVNSALGVAVTRKRNLKLKNGVNLNCIFSVLLKGLNNRILNGLFVLSMQYVD